MKRQAKINDGCSSLQNLPSKVPVVVPAKKQNQLSKSIGLKDLQKKMFEPVDLSVESAQLFFEREEK